MPTLDPRFVQIPPLQDYFVNKDTGTPLSGGIVTFFYDNDHTILKPVYQLTITPNNTYLYTQLANPLQLSSVGTFIDENGNDIVPYFFPYDGTPTTSQGILSLYFITVTDSGGIPQFTRFAWPNVIAQGNIAANVATTENLLSNPQFSIVNFNPITYPAGFVYTVSGTNVVSSLAPDWDIITSGTGTVTVTQIASTNISITAPYILDIVSAGITSLQLRQRLNGDPRLFAQEFVNGSFIAASVDNTAHQLIMSFVPSTNTVASTSYTLINTTTPIAGFNQYTGTADINGIINTDSPTNGWVDIIITMPPTSHIQITSIQLVGVPTVNTTLNWSELTVQRELDHLFNYYSSQLDIKPLKSYLVGWDFPLNPAQFGSTVGNSSASNYYLWDQTIAFQSIVSNLTAARNFDGSLVLASSDATNLNQIALIQYLTVPQITSMLQNPLSVNILASSSNPGGLVCTVSLWYTTGGTLPLLPTSIVTTLDANGHPSGVASGWVELTRNNNLGNAKFILTNSYIDNGFFGWVPATTLPANATAFAIVIGTGAITNAANIIFNSISLVPGYIPTRPAYQSYDDVLNDCQYYYEKSYDAATLPGTLLAPGVLITNQFAVYNTGTTQINGILSSVNIEFKTVKRTIPIATNLTVASAQMLNDFGNVFGRLYQNSSLINSGDIAFSAYTLIASNTKRMGYIAQINSTFLNTAPGGLTNFFFTVEFHWVVDLRLGIT